MPSNHENPASSKYVSKQNTLSQRMQNYRLNGHLTDVQIKVGEEKFPAHKIVLEDSSPVLKAVIPESKSRNFVVTLNEKYVQPAIMEDLLCFIYTSEVTLTTGNAQPLCIAAKHLNIEDLWHECEKFLCMNISTETALNLLLVSENNGLDKLRRRCVEYVREYRKTLFGDSKFLTFKAKELNNIIRLLNRHTKDEKLKETIALALIPWARHNDPSASSLPLILKYLPLEDLSPKILRHLLEEEIFQSSKNCARLIKEILDKASPEDYIKKASPEDYINKEKAFPTGYVKREAIPKIPKSLNCRTSPPSKKFKPDVETRIYCFGGRDENHKTTQSVSELNLSTNSWKSMSPMPFAKSHFGSAVIGSKVYLCGGITEDYKTYNTIEEFNSKINSWRTNLRSMPVPRSSCAAAAFNGYIYVTGGTDRENKFMSSAIRYNVEKDEWEDVAKMQRRRSGHQLVEMNGCLFAIGGFKEKTIEKYNPNKKEWRIVASAKYGDCWFGATLHAGKIYVCNSKSFDTFSSDYTWENINEPLNQFDGISLISINDKLWAIGGGHERKGGEKIITEFDPVTKQWRTLPDMDVARKFHCSFAISN